MMDLAIIKKSITTNTPLVEFVAGSQDLLRQLRISHKLYGREKEVEVLTDNFHQICARSPDASTLVLIHGGSGVRS